MYLMTFAAADPVGSLMGSGPFKNLLTMLLIGIAVLAMFYPTLLAKIKTGITGMIAEQLHIQLPIAVEPTVVRTLETKLNTILGGANVNAPPVAELGVPNVSVGDMVKQRAAMLKSACPKSDAALRLKWMELGYDPESAKTDYIAELEKQVAAAAVAAPAVITPPA